MARAHQFYRLSSSTSAYVSDHGPVPCRDHTHGGQACAAACHGAATPDSATQQPSAEAGARSTAGSAYAQPHGTAARLGGRRPGAGAAWHAAFIRLRRCCVLRSLVRLDTCAPIAFQCKIILNRLRTDLATKSQQFCALVQELVVLPRWHPKIVRLRFIMGYRIQGSRGPGIQG